LVHPLHIFGRLSFLSTNIWKAPLPSLLITQRLLSQQGPHARISTNVTNSKNSSDDDPCYVFFCGCLVVARATAVMLDIVINQQDIFGPVLLMSRSSTTWCSLGFTGAHMLASRGCIFSQ
jgi:hypothetical protein